MMPCSVWVDQEANCIIRIVAEDVADVAKQERCSLGPHHPQSRAIDPHNHHVVIHGRTILLHHVPDPAATGWHGS